MGNRNKLVPFTQYLLPNGQKRSTGAFVDEDTWEIAEKLLNVGAHFDAEILRTGQVSLTVELDSREDDPLLAIELGPNGPELDANVDRLIRNAWAKLENANA